MYFSFGVKHIVRTLADSREGMAAIVICSALTEVHNLAVSTHIIQEYANIHSTDSHGTLMPSFRQWEALMISCSGILARSPFGSVVEFFLRFHPEVGLCGDPKDMASALKGVARISNGLMRSMVLTGGSECGFIAAIAQWLLSLKIVVQDVYGNVVYPSAGADADDYQVMVIYSKYQGAARSLSRTADTYYIDSIKDLLSDSTTFEYMSGRVDWESAFTHTFGLSARRLFQVTGILGELIGSAAKIYSPHARNKGLNVSDYYRHSSRSSPEASGRAFIDLACRRIPEIVRCKHAIDLAVERTYDEAYVHFEKALALLQQICGCSMKCSPQFGEPAFIDLTGQDYLPSPNSRAGDHCLRVLAITIIQLVRQSSTVASIPSELCPKRRGLKALYEEVLRLFPDGMTSELAVVCLFNLDSLGLLDLAATIFGIHELPQACDKKVNTQVRRRASVLVNGGLCIVKDSVIRISSYAEESLCVHIIPGHV